jgi:hypothetical protein
MGGTFDIAPEIKGRLAQIDGNRMYLQKDDDPRKPRYGNGHHRLRTGNGILPASTMSETPGLACLLAVIASLILPVSIRGALTSESGCRTPFWIKLRGYHSLNDRTELSQRAERWNPLVVEVLDFYR